MSYGSLRLKKNSHSLSLKTSDPRLQVVKTPVVLEAAELAGPLEADEQGAQPNAVPNLKVLPFVIANVPGKLLAADGSYSYRPLPKGGVSPYLFEFHGVLPEGWTFNTATGELRCPPR